MPKYVEHTHGSTVENPPRLPRSRIIDGVSLLWFGVIYENVRSASATYGPPQHHHEFEFTTMIDFGRNAFVASMLHC
jgi:hypothetical protein